MNYTIDEIAKVTQGQLFSRNQTFDNITNVVYDSRKISFPKSSLFVALKGSQNDGHAYIQHAYEKGIRNFLVSKEIESDAIQKETINFIIVDSTIHALQKLAKHHRLKYNYPVIAITGSNGKTIVKEWLHNSLSKKLNAIQSPQSYNSQLGVALSLLRMSTDNQIAIIEAGISQFGEMERLADMIQPTIGILTNIGDAHSHGFESKSAKLYEKIKLFKSADNIIYNSEDHHVDAALKEKFNSELFSWGISSLDDIQIKTITKANDNTLIKLSYNAIEYQFELHLMVEHMIQNAMHVIATLMFLNWNQESIQNCLNELYPIANRLEIKEGWQNCTIIDDSYSSDIASFQLALEYLENHSKEKEKVVIMTGLKDQKNIGFAYEAISNLLQQKEIVQVVLISLDQQYRSYFETLNTTYFDTVDQLIQSNDLRTIKNACILLKGSSHSNLNKVGDFLSLQIHQTVLETNYNAIEHNLNIYKEYIKPDTKIMAILKAEAYGSGSIPIANFLEEKNIDYLGVALVDEAIKIRNAGIHTPIMILNVQENNLEKLWEYNLEPEVYSLRLLKLIVEKSKQIAYPISIHLKIDTGMRRLGFVESEIHEVITILKQSPLIKVTSIFSHLASSEIAKHDHYTLNQIKLFDSISTKINSGLNINPIRHILNTGGTLRFKEHQFDMVRLGLGIYGIDETKLVSERLKKAHALSARILQIKTLKEEEATGYSRSGLTHEEKRIAIVSIGYADGLIRKAGNNNYQFLVNGQLCNTIGNICMDVSMIDISNIENVKEGDEVIIFNDSQPIEKLAKVCETISYEILSRIAPRVKRTYIYK